MLQSGPFKSLLLCGVYVLEECVDVSYYVPVVSSCLFNDEITGMFCDFQSQCHGFESSCWLHSVTLGSYMNLISTHLCPSLHARVRMESCEGRDGC